MAPVLLPSGLHVGLPKWVDESDDPYIARLKEESYLPGVGYILEFFQEMLVGGACADFFLSAAKDAADAEFEAMIYGSDTDAAWRAVEAYKGHTHNVVRHGQHVRDVGMPSYSTIQASVEWRPGPEDIKEAVEEADAMVLHEDMVTDDSARTDDFGQESSYVDGEMDVIGELLSHCGRTTMQLEHTLSAVLAAVECKWENFTDRQRALIVKVIGETKITDTVTKNGEMRRRKVISSMAERANEATMQMLIAEGVDQHLQSLAVNDEVAHPHGQDEPKVVASLDNQANFLEWVAKKIEAATASSVPAGTDAPTATEAAIKKAQPAKPRQNWFADQAYKAVLFHAEQNSRTPRDAHNRAYAASVLKLADRIQEYDADKGFRVMLNKQTQQAGWVRVDDARVAYPHLPAKAKGAIKTLTASSVPAGTAKAA